MILFILTKRCFKKSQRAFIRVLIGYYHQNKSNYCCNNKLLTYWAIFIWVFLLNGMTPGYNHLFSLGYLYMKGLIETKKQVVEGIVQVCTFLTIDGSLLLEKYGLMAPKLITA